MVLSLLFGRNSGKKNGGRNSIGSLELDATMSESHSYKSRVTQLPIETGSNISDHVLLDPVEVTIEGFITDSPVEIFSPSLATVGGAALGNVISEGLGGAIGAVVGGFLGNAVTGTDTSSKRTQDAYRTLMDIRDKREVVTLVTGLNVYQDMMLTTLDIPLQPDTGQSLRFTANFIKIKKVSPSTVAIPDEILSRQAADLAAANKDLGKQVTKPLSGAKEDKAAEIIKGIETPTPLNPLVNALPAEVVQPQFNGKSLDVSLFRSEYERFLDLGDSL